MIPVMIDCILIPSQL